MEFSTPDGLSVKLIVGSEAALTFALCHPLPDGPPDWETSIVFEIAPNGFTIVRLFELEIVSMIIAGGTLYCVDNHQRMYAYRQGNWTDLGNDSVRPYRINALKYIDNEVYGVANDGMIFLWQTTVWIPLTRQIKDLYLYDIVNWPNHGLMVSGENGFLAILGEKRLNALNMPTNIDLTNALPLSNGDLLVTGWNATAIVVSPDEAVLIDAGGRDLNFLNAVQFGQHCLIAAASEILEYRNGKLEVFSVERASRLCVSGDRLWKQSIGGAAYLIGQGAWNDLPLAIEL